MEQQFSLSWDAHKKNICNGLSSLQQNGEFVDMTLAADGHHVKVHQIIIALASPYIKELISSTQCQHPIIFLNKVSYTTLCSILEYIYTGETLVTKDKLPELVEAGKELRIQGLQDMKLELSTQPAVPLGLLAKHRGTDDHTDDDEPIANKRAKKEKETVVQKIYLDDDSHADNVDDSYDAGDSDRYYSTSQSEANTSETTKGLTDTPIQYTISNQGSLQLILNRYMYFLQYTSRISAGHRNWLCVENRNNKCAASVITKGDVIVKRIRAHNHPFHDKKILKKVRDNAVYSTLNDAEALSKSKKDQRRNPNDK